MDRSVPEPTRTQFDRIFIRVLPAGNLIIIHRWVPRYGVVLWIIGGKLRNILKINKNKKDCGARGFQNPCQVASSTVLISLATLRPDHNFNIMPRCAHGWIRHGLCRDSDHGCRVKSGPGARDLPDPSSRLLSPRSVLPAPGVQERSADSSRGLEISQDLFEFNGVAA